jgi:signal transduction histidine kinase
MFVLFVFMWAIAIVILVNKNKSHSDRWGAYALFLFGLAGLAVVLREYTDKGVLSWLFPAAAASIGMLWGPYVFLIATIYYAGLMPPTRQKKYLLMGLAALPLLIFYLFVPVLRSFGHVVSPEAFAVHLVILVFCVAPYYLGATGLLLWNLIREGNCNRKRENIATAILCVPLPLAYYVFAYILPSLGFLNAWETSLLLMFLLELLILFFIIYSNVIGLSYFPQNASRDNVEGAVIEGAGSLHVKMKQNVVEIEHCLQEILSQHQKVSAGGMSSREYLQVAITKCNDTLTALDEIYLKLNPAKLKKREASLVELVEQALQRALQADALCVGKNLRVMRDYQVRPMVVCDPVYIQEAVFNLIANAIEAIPAEIVGELTIGVTQEKSKIRISVKDNGVGVDQKQLKWMGLPLITTKCKEAHFGLGLYYVRKIVEMHNGCYEQKNTAEGGMLAQIILLA